MNRKALLKQMQESQQPPTPEDQQEQESMAEQMAKNLASLRSMKAQEATGLTPLKLVKHEGRDPPDESAPTVIHADELARQIRRMQKPSPQEQAEQEAAADLMAKLHASHQSKKDQSTS